MSAHRAARWRLSRFEPSPQSTPHHFTLWHYSLGAFALLVAVLFGLVLSATVPWLGCS